MREEFQVFGRPDKAQPFCVEMAGISYCDGSYRIERACSDVTVMEYVIKGKGTLETRGERLIAQTGDVYILHQRDRHLYYSDAENPWVKLFFNVSGELAEQLLDSYCLGQQVLIPQCPLGKLFQEFYELTSSGLEQSLLFQRCALKMHEIIIAVGNSCQRETMLSKEALQLKLLLDSRISGNITIGELARRIYHSPDYTIKLFKRVYGRTPYAYLLEQKIHAAKSLLRNTNLSIKEISQKTGFEDQHYFSNLFKKQTGESPVSYRRQSVGAVPVLMQNRSEDEEQQPCGKEGNQ